MVLDAAGAHFGKTPAWRMQSLLPPERLIDVGVASAKEWWPELFRAHFDIERDHRAFTAGANLDDAAFAAHFDGLRRVYPDRLEYPRFRVDPGDNPAARARLRALGFAVGY